MTFYTISLTPNLPWQTFNITLSGVIYGLTFDYNVRSNTWTMDIMDSNGNEIISSLPLLINRNMTGQYRSLAVPVGIFFVLDETGNQNQPGLNSFGTTHNLYYGDPT